jgi:hypothetical protein
MNALGGTTPRVHSWGRFHLVQPKADSCLASARRTTATDLGPHPHRAPRTNNPMTRELMFPPVEVIDEDTVPSKKLTSR